MRLRPAAAALCAALVACAGPSPLPAPPTGIGAVAVLPALNRSGRELEVSGRWFLDGLLGRPLVTVPDLLRTESVRLLSARGFAIADEAGPGVPALRFTLLRWEPALPPVQFVRVTVEATLEDGAGGRELWRAERRRWMVDTRGQPSAAAAYGLAARRIVAAFLDGWRAAAGER